jgi:hypothetical protein
MRRARCVKAHFGLFCFGATSANAVTGKRGGLSLALFSRADAVVDTVACHKKTCTHRENILTEKGSAICQIAPNPWTRLSLGAKKKQRSVNTLTLLE